MKMIQGIAKMMPNERRVKFSWILKSPPDTFSSPTCNKWKWNKPKWKHKFCDIQPNIQQNTIPKLKGAILNAAEMTCRKVNKPGCATVRNQVTALFSLPMRLGQHVFCSTANFTVRVERIFSRNQMAEAWCKSQNTVSHAIDGLPEMDLRDHRRDASCSEYWPSVFPAWRSC